MIRLNRPARHPAPETLIALIDVVFFLLVFFMLIARLDATAPYQVPPPVARTGATLPGGGLSVAVARDGSLWLDGRQVGRAELLRALGDHPGRRINLETHRDAELRHVLPLISALEAEGLRDVVLVVTPGPR